MIIGKNLVVVMMRNLILIQVERKMDSKRKQQLMQRTRQENNCLIWTGSLDKLGYGHTTLNGKSMYTHRVSYILHIGDIPKGLQVDHLCNNKSCINPDHLEAVTPKENLRRAGNFNHNTKKLRCPLGHTYTIEYLKNGRNHRICTICRRYRWYLKDQRLASSSFSKSELDKRINLFMTLQETEQCVQPEISEFCTKCE